MCASNMLQEIAQPAISCNMLQGVAGDKQHGNLHHTLANMLLETCFQQHMLPVESGEPASSIHSIIRPLTLLQYYLLVAVKNPFLVSTYSGPSRKGEGAWCGGEGGAHTQCQYHNN